MSGDLHTVHRRRLAKTLRTWRENAGYSVKRAAEELLCGAGTVSRMESGASAEPLRVKAALEMYGAPAELVSAMAESARAHRRRPGSPAPDYDFAEHFGDFVEYLRMEDAASEITVVSATIPHLPLFTAAYSREIASAYGVFKALGGDGRFLTMLLGRAKLLTRENPAKLTAILSEAVLRIQVGGPAVLRGQLDHLIHLAETAPNVDLRIVPYTAGAYAGLEGNYLGLSFPGAVEEGPELVSTINLFRHQLRDDPASVAVFRTVFAEASAKALDRDASLDLMRRVKAELVG